MITKMKKLILLMSESAVDVDADLTVLGKLGVVHVSPFQPAKDESIERVDARIKQLENAITILNTYQPGLNATAESGDADDFSTMERGDIRLLEKVLEAENCRQQLERSKTDLTYDLEWFANWGNVSFNDLSQLNQKGVWLRLYLVNDKELMRISGRENIQVVGKLNELNQVVLVSENADEKLDFHEINLPERKLEEVKVQLADTNRELAENNKLLARLSVHANLLVEALAERKRRFDVRNIQYGGVAFDSRIRCWKGFIPENLVEKFTEAAEQHQWGYVISEPTEEEADEVPTLVRTSRWAERVQPVMDFMGLVPGYKELDVSKVFMIFFTFFTGILVGDAAYGLVFLLITFLVHRSQKFVKQIEFSLMYTLSVSILFWGVLTGTYFGAEAIAEIPFLARLRISQLASFGGDSVFTQKFMFLIGAIHLTVGHLQVAWKYSNSVRAIAQLGWVAIIWGLYLIVSQMVLGIAAPEFMVWLFIGGAALVALFSNPGASFLKGMLSSLGNLPLSIINGFSDIISYIRLYAVGLSTVLMAASFNQMAIGDGVSTVASGIGAALILIFGHGLNMILAAMAVLVHGVRLNMLEYAGHAGVEFSGNEYKPFRLNK
ncbi:V-type ATP synthase subunit I [Mangrovibacterium sp.]|uniref:V-type ATP synthase subunit I n=1 Tax=Mangrovibacterium sp. TaxID=1961364 RepID=UPI0035633521